MANTQVFRKFLLKSEEIYPFPLEEAVLREVNNFQKKTRLVRAFNSTPVLSQEAKGNKHTRLIFVSLWNQGLGGHP